MTRETIESAGPARPERADWVILSVLLALTALFLFPYLFLGRAMLPLELLAVFQPWASHPEAFAGEVPLAHNPLLDTLQQYYPRRVYMTEALHGGWLPLWNPSVYGGSPFLAAQQGAVLYPPAWVLSLLPPAQQFGWSALLHLFAAAAGMYLFLRALDVRRAAATLGAVAFAFNGFMVVWLAYVNVTQWTLCWLPLVLYCWERGLRARDGRWMAGTGALLALLLLGGHGQSSAYALLIWGTWALLRAAGIPGRPLSRLRNVTLAAGLPLLLGIGLSLGHLLPVLEFVPRTDRGARVPWESVVQAGMPPAQLWTLFLPRLFGDGTVDFGQQFWLPTGGKAGFSFVERTFYPGISVLVLAAAGLTAMRCREPRGTRLLAVFAATTALLGVLWAMGTLLYWPLWRLLPGFGQFTATGRILGITGWAMACLGAVGLHQLLERRRSAVLAVGAAGASAAVVALIGHFIYGGADPNGIGEFLAQSGRASLETLANRDLALALAWVAGIAGIAFALRRQPRGVAAAAVAIVAADLFAFGFGFNPRADPALLAARTPELEALAARTDPERFLSPRPADASRDLKERMPSNLPSTYGAADLLGSDSFVPLRYRAWEEATQKASGGSTSAAWTGTPNVRSAGVRVYLAGDRQRLPGLKPITGTLSEDPEALPYARLHGNAQALGSQQEVLQALAHPRRVNRIPLLGPGGPTFNGPARIEPFETRRINGNRLRLTGFAPMEGMLVVAEAHDPGWKARVDGRAIRPVPADHLLIGLPVPQGARRVDLVYAPASFRIGLFGSLTALALLVAALMQARRPRSV